jgi:hypothetical protein
LCGFVRSFERICAFDAVAYRGVVDIVTGGFPCQPFNDTLHVFLFCLLSDRKMLLDYFGLWRKCIAASMFIQSTLSQAFKVDPKSAIF